MTAHLCQAARYVLLAGALLALFLHLAEIKGAQGNKAPASQVISDIACDM